MGFRIDRLGRDERHRSEGGAKVIDLRPSAQRSQTSCPECATAGKVDWIDLVRGTSFLHCPSCCHLWQASGVSEHL